jgi:proline iminopeptidase
MASSLTALVTVLTCAAVGFGVLLPAPTRESESPNDAGHTWDLSTGSTIAYEHVPARGNPRATPVVLLHGGPGTPSSSASDTGLALASAGYDVWAYDQVGAGRSERLDDPTEYTVDRNVDDLEAIRKEVGAERVVLIGSSWGATLAAAYMAKHPERVARAVMVSPGTLWAPAWEERTKGELWDRVPQEGLERVAELTSSKRLLAWSLLMEVNPRAAHSLIDDDEIDAIFAELIGVVAGAATCQPTQHVGPPATRPGYYANQLVSADELRQPDPRPALTQLTTPVLVVRGECDYIHPDVAQEYVETFRAAELRTVPGAGHVIRADRPMLYHAALLEFLE